MGTGAVWRAVGVGWWSSRGADRPLSPPLLLPPPSSQYNLGFYLTYLARWPALCLAAVAPGGAVAAYCLGKVEGDDRADPASRRAWHGHVSAVAVAPAYRRRGLARRLMEALERESGAGDCFFVDLFVRASNAAAIAMYGKMGYTVYRRVLGYYSGSEDALDMRKALAADTAGASAVPRGKPVTPAELEWD